MVYVNVSTGIDVATLARAVGRYLGYPRSNLSGTRAQDVEDVIEAGLREVYWHQYIEEGQTMPHVWSFLRTEETITTESGISSYTQSESYRELPGSVVIFTGDNKGLLTVISEGDMRALHATDDNTGTPRYIAVLGDKVNVHPTPDGEHTIKYMATKTPSTSNDIPSSAAYSELVTTSCLAAADRMFNKETTANSERFQALLQAAVKYDRQLTDVETEHVWPEDFSTSLELTKKQLDSIVGRQMRFPADPAIWSVGQKAEVRDIVRAGLRKFYNPVVIPGDRYPHEWSFLRPIHSITFKLDQTYYDMPDDFAMLDGPVVYDPEDNVLYTAIAEIGENQLRRRIQHSLGPSRPVVCAVWQKEFDEREGTRWMMGVAPEPDGDMGAKFRYKINPIDLGSDVSLPHGGPQYTQTIIEACLSAVEINQGQRGVHSQEFEQLLVASVQHDRNASTADYLDSDEITAAYGYGQDNHIVGYGDLDIT